jgi:hypothetical protein
MTTDQPQHGGSYIRGKDGKLTRVDDSAAPADTPAPAGEATTAARSGASTKKEK